jgi:hypothetical protein
MDGNLMENKMIYFWYKLSRVTGKVAGKCHKFFASTGTDAETLGRFEDSVTRIGYTTVYPGQTTQHVFEMYKDQIQAEAIHLGFESLIVTSIGKREYDSLRRVELKAIDAFLDELAAPAYAGKRMVKR